jgi:hypothetical protein
MCLIIVLRCSLLGQKLGEKLLSLLKAPPPPTSSVPSSTDKSGIKVSKVFEGISSFGDSGCLTLSATVLGYRLNLLFLKSRYELHN